ncbi:MAG: hypothetical protein M3Z22_02430, partial [Verrucomicrobiota bacterium]|nr:hypothetical protein [Verrucomicrobiota bacterium]
SVSGKSVAVLPFENLSADPNNAFFVNGVQDEILTRAAKISSLKVISRSSTRQYEAKPAHLHEVAKQLGVAHILDGSVQKIAHKVRVNVQLIRAATDEHLWSETYDRQLLDVFAVESDIAARIAISLQAMLSPEEKTRVNEVPTLNPEAYEAYLQGREILFSDVETPENSRKQKELYARAIALDPRFAVAHAALSTAYSFDSLDNGTTPEKRWKARAEADEALRLQPDLGEAHVALGSYYYRIERNYEAAGKEYAIAVRALPNDGELLRNIALMARRQGHWREAILGLQRAASLDPRSALLIKDLAEAYIAIGNFAAAEETMRDAVDVAATLSPEAAAIARWKLCDVQWIRTGSVTQFHAVLDQLPANFDPVVRGELTADLGLRERDAETVLQALAAAGPEAAEDVQWARVQALVSKGDSPQATPLLDTLISAGEAAVKENPTEARYHSALGLRYAYRGRTEDALREGRRAVELMPESKDAVDGALALADLARIYARVGEADLAVDILEHLLVTPCLLPRRDLQVMWDWDPLRDHPQFKKILSGPEPKVIYN